MVNFKICLAERVISVNAIYESTLEFCKDYLTDREADFSVSVSEQDIAAESAKSDEERRLEGLSPYQYPPEYLETLAIYRKIAEGLVNFGIILFHGSAISVDGEAYIFTAKSGTGKSTHTRLWRQLHGDRAVMVNDDKPLIAIKDGEAVVYGTPWNGKHGLGTNISAPIKAICILERAEKNNIKRESVRNIFGQIFSQTYRFSNPMGMKKTLEILEGMMNIVPVYRLGCNMNIEAAEVAYNGMRGHKNEA